MKLKRSFCLASVVLLTSVLPELHAADKKKQAVGIFERATDIGEEILQGSSSYDPLKKQYTVKGGGADIWGSGDDFHFLWRKVSGNWVTLTCTLDVPPERDDPYPKAGLMFRTSLERNAPFVDAILHANGLIALQFRRETGEPTGQIVTPVRGNRLMLERKNDWFVIWVGTPDGGFTECGSMVIDLPQTFYVGLAVCAHDPDKLLTVRFSEVTLATDSEGYLGP